MNDFEGPPNVAVTMPADAPGAARASDDSDDTDSVNIRVHNRLGGFKFFFIVVIVITALTSALCFFKAVSTLILVLLNHANRCKPFKAMQTYVKEPVT